MRIDPSRTSFWSTGAWERSFRPCWCWVHNGRLDGAVRLGWPTMNEIIWMDRRSHPMKVAARA